MNIHIKNPEEIIECCSELDRLVEESNNSLSNLQNHINALESAWSSETNDKISFVDNINNTCNHALTRMENIRDLSNILRNYATEMQESASTGMDM